MAVFQKSIEEMLWPERRRKDELFANDTGPGVGVIDRLTTDTYLDVPAAYVPGAVKPLVPLFRRLFPGDSGKGYALRIGPFPKGFPVGLIANVDLLGTDLPPNERAAHLHKLTELVNHAIRELSTQNDFRVVVNRLIDEMLAVSKCRDFVVNKGHYFGTDDFPEEPGLSDADKRALVEFLKTF